jgi:hypothetical protein
VWLAFSQAARNSDLTACRSSRLTTAKLAFHFSPGGVTPAALRDALPGRGSALRMRQKPSLLVEAQSRPSSV